MINKEDLENKIIEYMEVKYKNYIDVLENEIDNQLIKNNGKAYIDKFKFISLMQDARNKYNFKTFNNASRGFLLLCSEYILFCRTYYSCSTFEKFLDYSSDDNRYGKCLRYIIKKYYKNGYIISIVKVSEFNYELRIKKINN